MNTHTRRSTSIHEKSGLLKIEVCNLDKWTRYCPFLFHILKPSLQIWVGPPPEENIEKLQLGDRDIIQQCDLVVRSSRKTPKLRTHPFIHTEPQASSN